VFAGDGNIAASGVMQACLLLLTGSLGCTGRPDRPGPGGRGSAMAGRYEVSGRSGDSRFRITATNGDAIASSEGYTTRAGAPRYWVCHEER
jgi:hypothetical protein